ncbi:class I SAM-dependent methyltransferase [Roseovarius sp. D22-M7]|uniref:class I SAM-dependent methyltransferase n=1 Tax=Roseovarius sp. D22-M7 TaxID=3127116 RepID=UPI00300FD343
MVVPHLVAAVNAGPDTDALDLCCGHGNVSAALVAAGARVTGLDFSAAMLELARAAVPGLQFVHGDAMRLSFPDASFDAVTIGFGMPHVPQPRRVIAQARRVLRPGGRIAFSTWCGPEVDGAFGYVFGAIGTPWIAGYHLASRARSQRLRRPGHRLSGASICGLRGAPLRGRRLPLAGGRSGSCLRLFPRRNGPGRCPSTASTRGERARHPGRGSGQSA